MSPDIASGPLGPKIDVVENHCSRVLFFKLEMPWKERSDISRIGSHPYNYDDQM